MGYRARINMKIRDRIEAVLEHFDYCLVSTKGYDYDNVIVINIGTTPAILYRQLTIVFGAERVGKHKSKIKVAR